MRKTDPGDQGMQKQQQIQEARMDIPKNSTEFIGMPINSADTAIFNKVGQGMLTPAQAAAAGIPLNSADTRIFNKVVDQGQVQTRAQLPYVMAKTVMVSRNDGKNEFINLIGMNIFDEFGDKINDGLTGIQSSQYADLSSQNLITREKLAHTQAGPKEFLGIDLGRERPVSKVVVYNRTDCCMERINGCMLTLNDQASRTVGEMTLDGSQVMYVYTVGGGGKVFQPSMNDALGFNDAIGTVNVGDGGNVFQPPMNDAIGTVNSGTDKRAFESLGLNLKNIFGNMKRVGYTMEGSPYSQISRKNYWKYALVVILFLVTAYLCMTK